MLDPRELKLLQLAVEDRLLPAERLQEVLAEVENGELVADATGVAHPVQYLIDLGVLRADKLRPLLERIPDPPPGSARFEARILLEDSSTLAGTPVPKPRTRSHTRAQRRFAPATGSSRLHNVSSMPGMHVPEQRYRYREPIGEGGMGEVFVADDQHLRRKVAIKRMLVDDEEADSEDMQRFIEEAQLTGQLEHPNIVPVHDIGVDTDGRVYFTMKLVRGRSLEAILAETRRLLVGSRIRAKRLDSDILADSAEMTLPPELFEGGVEAQTILDADIAAGDFGATGQDRRVRPEQALNRLLMIFLKVCDAVSFAHAKGVIHRDIKPENVMVGSFGEVQLMDWGLARIIDRSMRPGSGVRGEIDASDIISAPGSRRHRTGNRVVTDRLLSGTNVTVDGTIAGTPAYMSPEQARGEIDQLDERADVYGLGAILYEILTFQSPIEEKETEHALMKVRAGYIEPPSRRNTAWPVPRELEAVVMKAMAFNAADRYRTVSSLKADVEAWLSGRTLATVRYSTLELTARFLRRNAAMLVISVVAVVALFATLTWATSTIEGLKLQIAMREAESKRALDTVASAIHEADTVRGDLADAREAAIRAREDATDAQQRELEAIQQARQATTELDTAREEIQQRDQQIDGMARAIREQQALVAIAAARQFTADGDLQAALQRLAVARELAELPQGNWLEWDIRRRYYAPTGTFPDRDVVAVAVSADGSTAACARRDGSIVCVNVVSCTTSTVLTDDPGVRTMAFSPDGLGLYAASPGTLSLHDLTTGERVRRVNTGAPDPDRDDPALPMVALDPFAGVILLLSHNGLQMRSSVSLDIVPDTSGFHPTSVRRLDHASNGETWVLRQHVDAGVLGRVFYSWSDVANQRRLPWQPQMLPAAAAFLSEPDGSIGLMATATRDGAIQVRSGHGTVLRDLPGHVGGVVDLAFVRHGGSTRLVSAGADQRVQVCDVDTGHLLTTLDRAGPVSQLEMCASIDRLIVVGADGVVSTHDTTDRTAMTVARASRDELTATCAVQRTESAVTLATGDASGRIRLWRFPRTVDGYGQAQSVVLVNPPERAHAVGAVPIHSLLWIDETDLLVAVDVVGTVRVLAMEFADDDAMPAVIGEAAGAFTGGPLVDGEPSTVPTEMVNDMCVAGSRWLVVSTPTVVQAWALADLERMAEGLVVWQSQPVTWNLEDGQRASALGSIGDDVLVAIDGHPSGDDPGPDDGSSRLICWSPATGVKEPVARLPEPARELIVRDGRQWLAFATVGRTVGVARGVDGVGGASGAVDVAWTQLVRGGMVTTLAVTPPDDRPLMASGATDGTVHLWQGESGLGLIRLSDVNGPVSGLAFPDSRTLVATIGTAVVIYDLRGVRE